MTNTASLTDTLKTILADSFQLYVLSLNVHWNVTGPLFAAVHQLSEAVYLDLATANDTLAERLRALSVKAPASLAAFSSLGSVQNVSETASAADMLAALIAGINTNISSLKAGLTAASEAGDDVTAGLLTDRLSVMEKNRWMLSALAE